MKKNNKSKSKGFSKVGENLKFQKVKKISKRDFFALLFSLIAIAFLIIGTIYFLIDFKTIAQDIQNQEPTLTLEVINITLTIIIILKTFFAFVLSFVTYNIEKHKLGWKSLLFFSILSILSLTIESFIFGIIASILYIKRHKTIKSNKS